MRQFKNEVHHLGCSAQGADALMNQSLFLGTYPGLSEAMIERECAVIAAALTEVRR
jgi:hypothetical protein